jgi:hypothetical protein
MDMAFSLNWFDPKLTGHRLVGIVMPLRMVGFGLADKRQDLVA